MKKLSQILFSILIIFFTNFSVVFSAQWKINLISGKAKIIDGDTIKINGNNIRLLGIDAPEKNQICFKKGESYNCGSSSTIALKKYVGSKVIECAYTEKDRYGRILGTCYLWKNDGKKISLNRYMVFTGNAVAYKRYSKEYLDDEKWAKNNQLGMWQGKFIRPEEWRRKTK